MTSYLFIYGLFLIASLLILLVVAIVYNIGVYTGAYLVESFMLIALLIVALSWWVQWWPFTGFITNLASVTLDGALRMTPSAWSFELYSVVLLLFGVFLTGFRLFLRQEIFAIEYAFMTILILLGFHYMVFSADLLVFFFFLEIQSISLYIVTASQRYNLFSVESGFKYFIFGSVSATVLLFGLSFVYGGMTTTNYQELQILLNNMDTSFIGNSFLVTGFMFLVGGLIGKLGLAPLHIWMPDVYMGATLAALVLFIFAKLPLFYTYLYLFICVFGILAFWAFDLLYIVGLMSVGFGALGAFLQTNTKRFLAFSSVSNYGFVAFFGILGWSAVLYAYNWLFIYSLVLTTIIAFLMVIFPRFESIWDLDIFAGLPLFFRAAFSSFLFSLAGIPPFAGFFGKFLVFCVLAVSGLLLPAILLLLVSVMTAYYYIRFVRILFFFGNILRTLVLPISFILGITLGLVVLFNSGFVFFQGFLLDTLVLSI